jgi:predicted nucleic acid-binding protein
LAFLVDTCVLSELVKKRPDPLVVRWVDEAEEETLYLSALTIGELQKGVAKLRPSAKRRPLERWVATDLPARFVRRILPISIEVAVRWGELSGELERRGEPLPVIDALIAATALTSNLTVVTRNTTDLRRTGIKLVNPWPAAVV